MLFMEVTTLTEYLGSNSQFKNLKTLEQVNKKNVTEFKMVKYLEWWPEPGLNRRHKDFQSFALPTELPGLNNKVL